MNAIVYREPYKWPAGILAVMVHIVFFALLYFGFSWQTQQMQPETTMSVDLWQKLPDAEPPAQPMIEAFAPPQEAAIKPEVTQPPLPEKIIEPEILMPEKTKPEIKPIAAKPDKTKSAPSPEKSAPEKKPDTKPVRQEIEARNAEQTVREQAEKAIRERTEQTAAIGHVVDEYTGRIVNKIRRNIVMPPDVANDARAEFMVTLLPGGSVLSAKLTRSSGNAAYDNAVERSILKSQPLPLPAEAEIFKNFRELKLVFRPVE